MRNITVGIVIVTILVYYICQYSVGVGTDGKWISNTSVTLPTSITKLKDGPHSIIVGKEGADSYLEKPLVLEIQGNTIRDITDKENPIKIGPEVFLIV